MTAARLETFHPDRYVAQLSNAEAGRRSRRETARIGPLRATPAGRQGGDRPRGLPTLYATWLQLASPFLSMLDTRRRDDDGEARGLPHQNVRSVQAHMPYLLTEPTERTFWRTNTRKQPTQTNSHLLPK